MSERKVVKRGKEESFSGFSACSFCEKKCNNFSNKSVCQPVVQNAREFMVNNKGLRVSSRQQYDSPRISSEFFDCAMPFTFDQYSMCSYGCLYCFSYYIKTTTSMFDEKLHHVNAQAMVNMIRGEGKSTQAFNWYHDKFFKQRHPLHWGGLADPFCSFEKNNRVGLPIMKALAEVKYPTVFCMKGSTIFEPDYWRLFEKSAKNNNFIFQISMSTGNDQIAKFLEVGVMSPSKRIELIRRLTELGYYVVIRLRPFIIGITDRDLEETLERAKEAGAKALSVEFFGVDRRTSSGMIDRYNMIGRLIGVDNLLEYYQKLSPNERGTFLRLNRMVKEPFVKRMYLFCKENNILFGTGDPDFKELNMSGNCCGLPDIGQAKQYGLPEEFEGWSRGQVAYHLRELRKLYHRTGEIGEIGFTDVFKEEGWMEDKWAIQKMLAVCKWDESTKRSMNRYAIARRLWNNPRSPSFPQNYFHGKLLVSRIDENGDYVFKYNPMDYEDRWKAEGIDLSE